MNDRPQRAAIYARFSSELQDARSLADQVALFRDHARRQHWAVVQVYADEAVSGASVHGRDALMRMIGDAERGSFDVILVEHIDRLARNAADTIRLREQMEFIGVEIHTCASGLVTEMHAGLEGLMSAMYLKQLAVHVRRGRPVGYGRGFPAAESPMVMRQFPANVASAPSSRRKPPSCGASSLSILKAGRRVRSRSTSTANAYPLLVAISGVPRPL
jgi:DNA invertase Pin-like site-specific DNA recombinase